VALFIYGDGADEKQRSGFDKHRDSDAQDVAAARRRAGAQRRPSDSQQANREHSRRFHQFLAHNLLIIKRLIF